MRKIFYAIETKDKWGGKQLIFYQNETDLKKAQAKNYRVRFVNQKVGPEVSRKQFEKKYACQCNFKELSKTEGYSCCGCRIN